MRTLSLSFLASFLRSSLVGDGGGGPRSRVFRSSLPARQATTSQAAAAWSAVSKPPRLNRSPRSENAALYRDCSPYFLHVTPRYRFSPPGVVVLVVFESLECSASLLSRRTRSATAAASRVTSTPVFLFFCWPSPSFVDPSSSWSSTNLTRHLSSSLKRPRTSPQRQPPLRFAATKTPAWTRKARTLEPPPAAAAAAEDPFAALVWSSSVTDDEAAFNRTGVLGTEEPPSAASLAARSRQARVAHLRRWEAALPRLSTTRPQPQGQSKTSPRWESSTGSKSKENCELLFVDRWL
mmetsp:Transcript_28924/g.93251  ORF Transcript_28924/g.93251 Transcript_28924/m.93251 type:complete len:294 (+) Transcript_28924:1290-2171(+)